MLLSSSCSCRLMPECGVQAPLSSTEMCYLVAHRSVRVLMDGQVRTLSSRWRSDGQVFVCELDKATEVLVLPSFVAGTVFHGTLTPDKSDDKCCRLNIDKPYCMESLWPLVGTCRTIEALRQCPLDYATLVLSAALQKTFLKDFGSAGELLSGSWKGREGYAMTVQELNVALGMENRTVLAVLLEVSECLFAACLAPLLDMCLLVDDDGAWRPDGR